MQFQYTPYILPLFASAFTSLSLGMYALLVRRSSKGSGSFILSMLVVTIWSSGNALEMASIDFSTKLFWANVQYFAYCYSPVTLLAMCMEFTGYDGWLHSRKVLWLTVIPTVIILLVWTDGLHGLIRHNLSLDYNGSFPVIEKEYGPFFYIHAIYSHSLNILAWVLLIKAVFFKNTIYRKQAVALLFGLSLIIVPNIIYISGLSPFDRFDVTPVCFGPSGLIIAWGIFRYKLFDVVPVARATVIENMDAGVMVLDLQDRVLDINPAFRKILNFTASNTPVRTIGEVCGAIPELINACIDRSCSHTEFITYTAGEPRVNEVFLSPLSDSRGMMMGRLVVTYDITEKKQEQQRYLKQQWRLAVTEERERLARDLHDNLGQVLGFINLQAQGIKQELANVAVNIVDVKLDKLIGVSQSAHSDIRAYVHNVRNTEAVEKDFMTNLMKNIISFEEQSGLEVKLHIPMGFTGEELRPDIRVNLLNIIKEALNNIRKHAVACHAGITFSYTRDRLQVSIEDDGKGFDIASKLDTASNNFGLKIMRERAIEVGAQVDIKSIPEKGTSIIVAIPVNEGGEGNENEANAG